MSQKLKLVKQTEERRQYCRIDDDVILRYRLISEQELPVDIGTLDTGLPNRFTLTATFAATSQQMELLLHGIQEQSVEVASYLRLLDRKLELVARTFLMQEIDVHKEPTCSINLSAGGIRFHAEVPIKTDALLEVELILLPSYTGILTYGQAVYCRHEPGEQPDLPYRIGVEFCRLREKDRDLIVKHVLTRESHLRRVARESSSNDTD